VNNTEEIFACHECNKYFVLPSCCSHYRQTQIDQLQKKLDIAIEFITEQVIIGRHGAEETLEQIKEMK